MRLWKRQYTVSIESPSRLTGFPHRVRARSEEEAIRLATHYWFQNCSTMGHPWYEWHYEVIA